MLVCKNGHLAQSYVYKSGQITFVIVCSQLIVVTDELVMNKHMQLPTLCT